MGGFTKLFSRILISSVWSESNETRIAWITLLALTGPDGVAKITIPGLARLAVISLQAAEEAIRVLSSPDQYSRTAEHEGRRIKEVRDGAGNLVGYFLYNYSKHRAVDATSAERQKRYRAKRDSNARQKTEDRGQKSRGQKAETTDNGVPATPVSKSVALVKAPSWTSEACDDWNGRFGAATAPGGRIGAGLKAIVAKYGWEQIRPAWQRYLEEKEPDFASPQDFAQKLGVWLSGRVKRSKGEEFVDRTRVGLADWLASRRESAG